NSSRSSSRFSGCTGGLAGQAAQLRRSVKQDRAGLRVEGVRCSSGSGAHMEKLNIGGRPIGAGEPPYLVGEIGANHNGDMKLCQRLIEAAKDSGADAVKFQSWSKESLISRAEYARNTRYVSDDKKAPSLEEAVEQYQLTPRQHRDVAAYCHE